MAHFNDFYWSQTISIRILTRKIAKKKIFSTSTSPIRIPEVTLPFFLFDILIFVAKNCIFYRNQYSTNSI